MNWQVIDHVVLWMIVGGIIMTFILKLLRS